MHRVSQEDRSLFWEVIVSVIRSITMYTCMCPIPNGFPNGPISLYTSLHLATASVEEYLWRFPVRRIPDRRAFSEAFNTLCERGTLPGAHVSSERARQQHMEERESFLETVLRNLTTSMRKLSTRPSVSQTHVQRTFHDDSLYPFHPQREQDLYPGGQCHASSFLSLVTH
jgi:hypothetical protein